MSKALINVLKFCLNNSLSVATKSSHSIKALDTSPISIPLFFANFEIALHKFSKVLVPSSGTCPPFLYLLNDAGEIPEIAQISLALQERTSIYSLSC